MNKMRILRWLLYSFILSIPISSFVSIRILLVTFVFSFFLVRSKFYFLELIRNSWPSIIYILILTLGLFYSQDLKTGIKVLETSFCFLSMPLIFNSTFLKEEDLNNFFYCFVIGLFVSSLICLTHATFVYFETNNPQLFFSYHLTEIINFHPTYLAYYLIFAITFGLYLLFYQKSNVNSLLIVFSISFSFLMMILTGGQTAYVSMLFIFAFFILKFLVEERTKASKLSFGLICVMLICMFLASLIELESKNMIMNDSWERFVLWESAIKAIPDLIWGVGTGDYKTILNDYYLKHNLSQYADGSYNSHNQFIQILLTNGLLGVSSILLLICRPLYLAVKNQHVLGVLVFFPFLIYGTTEVFLGRYQGVVFFALLHQVFTSYYSSLKPSLAFLKGA